MSCGPGPTPATRRPPGSWPSCWPTRGDLDELRARADAGDDHAARELARLLADRGDLGQLRTRADAGDDHAARLLADLLADRGDLDELRARACTSRSAAVLLADLLAPHLVKQGQEKAAEQFRQFGLNPDGSIATD